jgi:methylglyoxal synthase
MINRKEIMNERKNIALVAHDNRKKDLLEWVISNKEILKNHSLCATGTTGSILSDKANLVIAKFKSGPLGGDMQIGSKIVDCQIDCLIFFWDPLESQPHDPDIKALLRIAALYNIPVATNKSTADFIISSPLMNKKYERTLNTYKEYFNRNINL